MAIRFTTTARLAALVCGSQRAAPTSCSITIQRSRARYTIGPFPEFSVETARDKAFELRQSISNGIDPFTLRETKRREAVESEARLRTLRDLATEYQTPCNGSQAPKSVRETKQCWTG